MLFPRLAGLCTLVLFSNVQAAAAARQRVQRLEHIDEKELLQRRQVLVPTDTTALTTTTTIALSVTPEDISAASTLSLEATTTTSSTVTTEDLTSSVSATTTSTTETATPATSTSDVASTTTTMETATLSTTTSDAALPSPSAEPTVECPSYITITSVQPPTIYINRGSQILVLVGTNFTSLESTPYELRTTNVTFPEGAASTTVLSDTLLAVAVDSNALGLSGAVYTIGDLGIAVSGSAEVSTSIRWVDPVKSIATRVVPSRITVDVGGPVTVVGIDLLPPIGTALCVFNTTVPSSSNAAWDPVTESYGCNAPGLDASGVLELNMLYYTPTLDLSPFGGMPPSNLNRPSEWISTVINQPLLLFYRAGAPQIISAAFTGTGAVIVEFDRDVAVYDSSIFMADPLSSSLSAISDAGGRESFGCDKIFTNPTTAYGRLWYRYGVTECRVRRMGPHTFRFNVGAAGTLAMVRAGLKPLVVGDLLTVKPGAVWTAGQQLSQTALGGVVVTGPSYPDTPAQPILRVTAPQLVSGCSDVTYDLSRTMGALGRNFQSAVFSVSPAQPAIQTELSVFETMFLTTNELVHTIPAGSFPVGKYTVSFTVTNFLNATGSTSFTTEKLARDDVPYVTIVGPGNDAVLDQMHTVVAEAHRTCGQDRPVAFAWSSTDIDVSSVSTTVFIPPYSMPVQTLYAFVVQARYSDDPAASTWWLNYTFTSELDRVMPATVTSVVVGSVLDLETDVDPGPSPLVLGTTIFDSGYPLAATNRSDFACIWTCVDVTAGGLGKPCYKLETGQDLSVPAECGSTDITGFLAPGAYEFGFEAVRIETGATIQADPKGSTSLAVSVLDRWTPMVAISPSMPYPSAWSWYGLTASVAPGSTPGGAATFAWVSHDACDNRTFSTVAIADVTSPQLTFPVGSLIPAAEYCLTATATDPGTGNDGSATIRVRVLEPPAAGYCALNATDGVAYVDVFRYTCAGWVTDQLAGPLFYAFWIRKAGAGPGAWGNLGPRSESSVLDTVFSAGDYDVTVNVTDAAGSVAPIQPIYRISIAATNLAGRDVAGLVTRDVVPNSAYTFLNATIDGFAHTGDYHSAQTNLVVAIQDLVPAAVGGPYHSRLLDLYTALLDSADVYLDAVSGGPYMLQTLAALTPTRTLSMAFAERIFTLFARLIPQIDTTTSQAGTCVSATVADSALQIIDAVTGSLGVAQSTVITPASVASVLSTLDACLFRIVSCGSSIGLRSATWTRTIGIAPVGAATDDHGFCNAVVIPGAAFSTLGVSTSCFRYACGLAPVFGQAPGANVALTGGNVTDLTLFADSPAMPAIVVALPAEDIRLSLPVSPSVLAEYEAVPAGVVCAWWNNSAGAWDTSGCSLLGVDVAAAMATCACNHLTMFGVAVDAAAAAAPPASPIPTITQQQATTIATTEPATSASSTQPSAPQSSRLASGLATPATTTSDTPTPTITEFPLPPPSNPQGIQLSSSAIVAPSVVEATPGPAESSGSNRGRTAGIIIGILLAIALVLLILYILYRRHRRSQWYGRTLPPPGAMPIGEGSVPPPRHRQHPEDYYGPPQGYGYGSGGSSPPRPYYGSRENPGYDMAQPYPQQPPRWDEHLANVATSRDRLYG
ncbi:hypothetical protein HDU88_005814 [Geranomyces variabilis]|nr:hypothetical protein HDU88_005814 [Geranomyces variabilis]